MYLLQASDKSKTAKLEKADILEMTVKHVQYLHDKYKISQQKENRRLATEQPTLGGERGLQQGVRVQGVTRLPGGEIALVIAMAESPNKFSSLPEEPRLMWRPW